MATHEALVPTRYKDLADVDTWGIGHTHMAGPPDPRTMSFAMPTNVRQIYSEAWQVYKDDVADVCADVVRYFGTDLKQHELDGLAGWHLNTGGAHSSSAVAAWRAGDKQRAAKIIKSWNKVTIKGKKTVSQALVDRRTEEVELILNGHYPDRRLAVYGTNGHGSVVWRPLETFTYDEWMKLIAQPVVVGPVGIFSAIAQLLSLFFRKAKR